jgi:hypothetical protein
LEDQQMTQARQPFETLEAHGLPAVRQLSVFLENRVGQLMRLTKLFEAEHIKIMSIAVIDSADYAVARMLFDLPDEAAKLLHEGGFSFAVNEIVVVRLPHGDRGMLKVLAALLSGEIDLRYAYPLMSAAVAPAIALAVDDLEMAIDTLARHKFEVLSEADLHQRD